LNKEEEKKKKKRMARTNYFFLGGMGRELGKMPKIRTSHHFTNFILK
jgi:hypothetical protein